MRQVDKQKTESKIMSARKIKYDDIQIDQEISTYLLIDRINDLFDTWQDEWYAWRDEGRMTTEKNLERQMERVKEEIADSIIN
jgi:hypothetical protein